MRVFACRRSVSCRGTHGNVWEAFSHTLLCDCSCRYLDRAFSSSASSIAGLAEPWVSRTSLRDTSTIRTLSTARMMLRGCKRPALFYQVWLNSKGALDSWCWLTGAPGGGIQALCPNPPRLAVRSYAFASLCRAHVATRAPAWNADRIPLQASTDSACPPPVCVGPAPLSTRNRDCA